MERKHTIHICTKYNKIRLNEIIRNLSITTLKERKVMMSGKEIVKKIISTDELLFFPCRMSNYK